MFAAITVLHSDAFVLDPADVAAQFVLSVGVFNELGLDAEAPHLLQGASGQLNLIEDLGAHLDDFVRVQLQTK